ncbi:MAG: hypothetical protein RMY34_25995 [Aulosira sp. DedQUE10]|nr:hypothetical protein [Aulosira sp. DedQUE10]
MRVWVNAPHSGGTKIPEKVKQRTKERILAYAEQHYVGKYIRIEVHFQGYFCYIDAYKEPFVPDNYEPSVFKETLSEYIERRRNAPIHLCRLRYKGDEQKWTMAFYTYSHNRYEASIFDNGTFYGTPEEGFQSTALYLD